MLGLGWTEMLVIGIVALVVIGPKDLPVVMNRIGKVAGQIRRMGSEFQREINRSTGLDEVRNLRNSIASPLKKTADEIRREFNTMTPVAPKPSAALTPPPSPGEPAVELTADQKAAEYGFKPSAPKTAEPAGTPVADEAAKPAAKSKGAVKAAKRVIKTQEPDLAAAPAQSEPVQPRKRASRKIETVVEADAAPARKRRRAAKPAAPDTGAAE